VTPLLNSGDARAIVAWQPNEGNMSSFASREELTQIPMETAIRHQKVKGELLQTVLRIPGVVGASIRPYDLTVEKADLWSWDEIKPKIWDLLLAVNVPAMTPASEMKQ
jgi:hypothetical protein